MTTTETTEAPVVAGPEQDGEVPVEFPVLVIEHLDTSDGRFLEAGSLTHRALPLSLLAQPESSHGGDEPGPSVVVGRIDTLVRTPGPEVISNRTGEPFPEGSFVWSGTGAMSTTVEINGRNVYDLVKRRYLRGISVDLAGMDYEVVGEEGFQADPEFPRRQLVTHAAEIAAATLCCIPAFSDAYVQLSGETPTAEPVEGLTASATPAWRSAEVGDSVQLPAFLVAAAGPVAVEVPEDAVQQLTSVIESPDGSEQRDAAQLAEDIVAFVQQNWAAGGEPEPVAPEGDVMAAEPEPLDELPAEVDEVGTPDSPQPCYAGEEPAVQSLLFAESERYVATCMEHDADARAEIEAEGFEVEQVIPIEAGDEDDAVPAEVPV